MAGGHKCYAWVKPAALKKLARILEMLAAAPRTSNEIAAALPLSRRTCDAYLAHLRGEVPSPFGPPRRQVRIAEWRLLENGRFAALYGIGAKRDKRRPAARTVTERRRDIRNRLRLNDPDELLRRRKTRQAGRRKPRRDPMIAALFGAGAALHG